MTNKQIKDLTHKLHEQEMLLEKEEMFFFCGLMNLFELNKHGARFFALVLLHSIVILYRSINIELILGGVISLVPFLLSWFESLINYYYFY